MDDSKLLQIRDEIDDYLQKESEISKMLEEHIITLQEDLEKINRIIAT